MVCSRRRQARPLVVHGRCPSNRGGLRTGNGERSKIRESSPVRQRTGLVVFSRRVVGGFIEVGDERPSRWIFILFPLRSSTGEFFFFSSVVSVTSVGQRERGGFRPANGLPLGNPSYIYSMSDWTIGTLMKDNLVVGW